MEKGNNFPDFIFWNAFCWFYSDIFDEVDKFDIHRVNYYSAWIRLGYVIRKSKIWKKSENLYWKLRRNPVYACFILPPKTYRATK